MRLRFIFTCNDAWIRGTESSLMAKGRWRDQPLRLLWGNLNSFTTRFIISLFMYHLGCCYRNSANLGRVFVFGVVESNATPTAHWWPSITGHPSPCVIFWTNVPPGKEVVICRAVNPRWEWDRVGGCVKAHVLYSGPSVLGLALQRKAKPFGKF